MGQNLYKNWLLVSKLIWEIWITSNKRWKVWKVEIQWATFVQEIHSFSQNISEDLSNITFNYYENSPNSLCHFWNNKSFFTIWLVCIFFAHTLHTFDRNIPSKCKFSDFPLLKLKSTKLFMSFFKQKVSFSSKLWFGKWHEEFGKFSPEEWKVSKLGLWWDPFVQSRKCMSLKFTEDLCVMTMKNDAKREEKLTFKIEIRNLTNFDPSTWRSKKFAL